MRNFVQANPCWLVLKTKQMWITLILTANQFIFDGSWNKVVANKIWFTACNSQILEIVVRLAIFKVCIHWILNIHVALMQSEVCSCVSNLVCLESFMICTMFIKEILYIIYYLQKSTLLFQLCQILSLFILCSTHWSYINYCHVHFICIISKIFHIFFCWRKVLH